MKWQTGEQKIPAHLHALITTIVSCHYLLPEDFKSSILRKLSADMLRISCCKSKSCGKPWLNWRRCSVCKNLWFCIACLSGGGSNGAVLPWRRASNVLPLRRPLRSWGIRLEAASCCPSPIPLRSWEILLSSCCDNSLFCFCNAARSSETVIFVLLLLLAY